MIDNAKRATCQQLQNPLQSASTKGHGRGKYVSYTRTLSQVPGTRKSADTNLLLSSSLVIYDARTNPKQNLDVKQKNSKRSEDIADVPQRNELCKTTNSRSLHLL